MHALAERFTPAGLDREWQRIEVLAKCLLEARAGKEPGAELLARLTQVQQLVQHHRGEQSPWEIIGAQDLPGLALDILAAVYAPAIRPEAALLFAELQPGQEAGQSLAFLHSLLGCDDQEYLLASRLVAANGELTRRGLVQVRGEGPMTRLIPQPSVVPLISGLPRQRPRIPGAVAVDGDMDWDDLIIPPPQRTLLEEFLLWIRHESRVVEEWGGRSAGGPIALFSGPSGTGKTLAASVIANQLGWDLYRADLGALISKYIGETEKNLSALFDAVRGRRVLLQFDEVDALMGKRGDIKDARDRYANMEVSHLLSRIEVHRGPCILTTNLRKQIDPAFQRRFHFVVTFPRPEEQERRRLWERLIPPLAPRAPDLDLRLVAGSVPLTGGEIRNAATHAAVLASAEGCAIGMRQVTSGIWRVLQKGEGQARLNQLRRLGDFLPVELMQGAAP